MDEAMPKALMDLHQSSPLFIVFTTAIASALLLLISERLKNARGKRLPPGILGLPVVGETLKFLRAHKAHKSKEWIEQKVAKYGPVFKTSLMGSPTVVLTGQEGNRFLFHIDYDAIITKQPKAVREIVGKTNILELSGDEHKRIRGALMQFLKPEALQKLVGKMESAIRYHFDEFWVGNESVTVWPLMKKLTFQSACDLLLSFKDRNQREELRKDIITAMKGMWSLPLDLPGMKYNKSLKARSRIIKLLSSLLDLRREELQQGKASPRQDLLSSLLSMEDGNNNKALTDEEIIDNIIALLIAGHDTTAVLLTHLIRALALNPEIYQRVLQEQMKVLENKQPNEPLTWEDTQQMKYTWRVAQETSRLTPPLFGGFRKAIKDVEFGGYVIPKGWQLFWVTSVTHMNEEIFKDPTRFDPSHFESYLPPYSYTTFGGGARICPGYDFTKMEVLIFLHHLICKYKWSLVIPDERIICEGVPYPAMGLPINVQANNNS